MTSPLNDTSNESTILITREGSFIENSQDTSIKVSKSLGLRSKSITNVKADYLQTSPISKDVAPPTR